MSALRAVVVLVAFAAAPGQAGSTTSPPSTTPPPWAIDGVDVPDLVARMTVEQKVGQLLLLGFGGTVVDDTVAKFLHEMQPGGVALFSRNIDNPTQTVKLVRALREHDVVVSGTRVPFFVSVDQEGGNVVRLKAQAAVLPSAMALGAADDVVLAREVGRTLGRDLVAWGFNMNLAPVLDVSSNPKNPVIGIRSFGGDPARVGEIGVAYIKGLQDEGIVAVAKHFPGHGDTDVDSHYGLPVLQHDRDRLDAVELVPFARAFAEGLPAIMTAHIALPQITGDGDVPATISGKVLTGVLREDLGWDGLVITDGLEMKGIVDRYGAGEAAVQAVLAGADMVMVLWFPEKKREVRAALLDAVVSGRIPVERLDQAVRRVLEQKARAGLFSRPVVDLVTSKEALEKNDRRAIVDVARRAVTIVRDRKGSLPLRKDTRVVAVAAQRGFLQVLSRQIGAVTVAVPGTPTRERTRADAARVVELARDADVVVVGMQSSDYAPIVRAVQQALPDKPIVVVSFGSPWLVGAFPSVDGYVCAFGWRDDSARAAARVLVGELPARGTLPVRLAGLDDVESGGASPRRGDGAVGAGATSGARGAP